jgi:hypothetical protein
MVASLRLRGLSWSQGGGLQQWIVLFLSACRPIEATRVTRLLVNGFLLYNRRYRTHHCSRAASCCSQMHGCCSWMNLSNQWMHSRSNCSSPANNGSHVQPQRLNLAAVVTKISTLIELATKGPQWRQQRKITLSYWNRSLVAEHADITSRFSTADCSPLQHSLSLTSQFKFVIFSIVVFYQLLFGPH